MPSQIYSQGPGVVQSVSHKPAGCCNIGFDTVTRGNTHHVSAFLFEPIARNTVLVSQFCCSCPFVQDPIHTLFPEQQS
jgi:hypothetical protein